MTSVEITANYLTPGDRIIKAGTTWEVKFATRDTHNIIRVKLENDECVRFFPLEPVVIEGDR